MNAREGVEEALRAAEDLGLITAWVAVVETMNPDDSRALHFVAPGQVNPWLRDGMLRTALEEWDLWATTEEAEE